MIADVAPPPNPCPSPPEALLMRSNLVTCAVVVALALLAGCSSGSGGAAAGSAPRTMTVVTQTGSQTVSMRGEDPANVKVIERPVDVVWKALPAAYESVGISVTTVDISSRTFGASSVKMRKSLKGVPLSRYFDCGQTQIGPNADDYEITLTFLTRVTAASAGSSRVELTTMATARPVARRQNPQNCTALGTLDTKLFDAIRAEATRGG